MSRSRRMSMAELRSRAVVAAEREHRRLGTDLTRRVDIFDIIERAGIWLMFQPFKDLFGAFERQHQAVGIMINSKHPLSLQRFTAAHEYGHYMLGHQSSLDQEAQIQPGRQGLHPQEVEAQVFASQFLMPLQLVNTGLQSMGLSLQPESLTPRQAYLLALGFGVSYAALITHLTAIGKISMDAGKQLRRTQPMEIKLEIGRGIRPADVWADAWPIEKRDSGRWLFPHVNDEIHLSLPETPSTGHIWVVTTPEFVDLRSGADLPVDHVEMLALIAEQFESRAYPDSEMRIGGGGTRSFIFRVLRPGQRKLRLEKRRPWESATAADVFEVLLETSAKPTGDSEQGLSEQQKQLLPLAA